MRRGPGPARRRVPLSVWRLSADHAMSGHHGQLVGLTAPGRSVQDSLAVQQGGRRPQSVVDAHPGAWSSDGPPGSVVAAQRGESRTGLSHDRRRL